MPRTIATRLFLALTFVSFVVLTLSAVVTRWNFERGFLEYVEQQEAEMVSELAAALADVYRDNGGWAELENNPRRWADLLRGDREEKPGHRPPAPGGGPPRGKAPPAPPDPRELGHRISLLDAQGELVIGRFGDGDLKEAIQLDGSTVGFITIARRKQLSNPADQAFAHQQERAIVWTAIAALLIAAVFSGLLSRQLTRPIRALADGSRRIAAGELETRIEVARDDELGELAQDFNRLAATLEKNRDARQRWVADIAHELRTPLAILRGELDALEDGIRNFDAGTRKSLQSEVARLSQVVDDLHDLSTYDAGAPGYDTETLDLNPLLNAVLDNAQHRLHDARIELGRGIPDQPMPISANATKLEQLFTNLIENTLRYTDAPGTLHVGCALAEDNVSIEFADSAPGVPDESLPQLFERLFRVNASRNRESGGSGLGLSICKAIVAAHDGEISARHSESGGLLIEIRLPLARDDGDE